MKVVQTIELNEKERKVIQDFLYIMSEISDAVPNKSIEDVALYFCNNAGWDGKDCNVDKIHQIKEM